MNYQMHYRRHYQMIQVAAVAAIIVAFIFILGGYYLGPGNAVLPAALALIITVGIVGSILNCLWALEARISRLEKEKDIS